MIINSRRHRVMAVYSKDRLVCKTKKEVSVYRNLNDTKLQKYIRLRSVK